MRTKSAKEKPKKPTVKTKKPVNKKSSLFKFRRYKKLEGGKKRKDKTPEIKLLMKQKLNTVLWV